MFDDTDESCNVSKRLTCGLKMTWGIWHIFIITLEKCQNWYFHGILFSDVEMHELKLYLGVMCNDTDENDGKSEEELTCCFKIDIKNLTHFDSRTWKSQKLAL